ncbi:MAG: hypothetical protein AAGL10_03915 [Pseudomonadota bacterium]
MQTTFAVSVHKHKRLNAGLLIVLLFLGLTVQTQAADFAHNTLAAQSASQRIQPLPPMKEMIPVRAGIDRSFRFRASNLYRPAGFFEPEERHITLLRSMLQECGSPQCLDAARALTTKDFGFVPIDLTRDGPGAHGLLLPRAGGKACRADGCYWLVLSGNINRWAVIQGSVGFGKYLAVTGEYDRWAELREDELPDGKAHYFVTLRGWQGNYEQAQNRADLARIEEEVGEAFAKVQREVTLQNLGSTGNLGAWQPSGPPAGQIESIRDHWGNRFVINEYLPITNYTGQSDLGKYPELLQRRTAEQMSRDKGAVIDKTATARDGASPTLRLTSESSQILSFSEFDRGPDVYQLRIFYRVKNGAALVGDITPKFADGGGWTIGTLITPAYAPKDPFEWGVGYVNVTRYPDGAFGDGNVDGSLKSLSVELGPKDGKGDVWIEKIELWKLGFGESDPQLVPETP